LLGCHELQGFLFSEPLAADVVDVKLAEQSPTPALGAARSVA
jgi:hypothetical protein